MSKPAIIFLLANQLRFDMLDAYGDRQCPTPNLDQFSAGCTVFDRHFTPSPVSVPARGCLFTGLYPRQHGAIISGWMSEERQYGTIRKDTPLIFDHLDQAGYRVVHVGVQHVRTEPELGKRCPHVEFVGPYSVGQHHRTLAKRGLMLPDMTVFRDPVIEYNAGKPLVAAGTSARTAIYPLREDLFYDVCLAQRMARTIEQHDGQKPLCMFGMFWLPHPPLWAPRAWALKIAPEDVELPGTVGKWYSGMPATQLLNIPGQLGAHVPSEHWMHVWAVYMGMVSLLDHCVGMILDALRSSGMYDEALIVFTSDHGDMLGSHRLYGKMTLYEEVLRVPLLVKTPGQKNIRHVREMGDHVDLAAMLLDYAEAAPIPASPGRSLRGPAEGHLSSQPREYLFAAYDGNAGRAWPQRTVRSATHKLIHNIGDRQELYDLIEDPRETRNLIGSPDVAEVENQLRAKLNEWMQQSGDDAPPCEASPSTPTAESTSEDNDE